MLEENRREWLAWADSRKADLAAAEQRGAALAMEQVRRLAEGQAIEHLRHSAEAPPGSVGAYMHSDSAAALRELIDKLPAIATTSGEATK